MANDKIGVSIGAEYRREHLVSKSDVPPSLGDVNGGGAAKPPVTGGYDVYELFGEARIPLVQDQPWAKDITAELAYRYWPRTTRTPATPTPTRCPGDWTIVGTASACGPATTARFAPRTWWSCSACTERGPRRAPSTRAPA